MSLSTRVAPLVVAVSLAIALWVGLDALLRGVEEMERDDRFEAINKT